MGWADCGTDSKGRPIGYAFAATCDEPGCSQKIDRGLSYACGGMHGEDPGCENYFCERHLFYACLWYSEGKEVPLSCHDHETVQLCRECIDLHREQGSLIPEDHPSHVLSLETR